MVIIIYITIYSIPIRNQVIWLVTRRLLHLINHTETWYQGASLSMCKLRIHSFNLDFQYMYSCTRHTHTHVLQCRPASVRLAQAHPKKSWCGRPFLKVMYSYLPNHYLRDFTEVIIYIVPARWILALGTCKYGTQQAYSGVLVPPNFVGMHGDEVAY